MTKRLKRFPASFRFVAVTFALVATASLATSAAADPPSAEEVQDAKDRVAQLAREVHRGRSGQLDTISVRRERGRRRSTTATGRLEKLNAELRAHPATLGQARARYDAHRGAAERARADHVHGGTGLGPRVPPRRLVVHRPVGPLEYVRRGRARTTPTSRRRCRTPRTCSSAQGAEPRGAAGRAAGGRDQGPREAAGGRGPPAAGDVEVRRDRGEEGRRPSSSRRSSRAQRQAWLNVAVLVRRLAARLGRDAVRVGRHAPGLPGRTAARVRRRVRGASLRGRLPPARRRRHPGADGTPIYATFDGYATRAERARRIRGRTCTGAPGYTYNAHLSSYSEHSTGPVQAGDVIGYVGDFGRRAAASTARPLRVPPELVPVGMADELLRYTVIGERAQPVPAAGRRLRLVWPGQTTCARARSAPARSAPTHAASTIRHDRRRSSSHPTRRTATRSTAPASPATTT